MFACFWLRGVIPASWLQVDPPPDEVKWKVYGINDSTLNPGCLGVGQDDDPVLVFGDASGGPDTKNP
eukprot:6427097-Pyramimonas_sp.AAC.1